MNDVTRILQQIEQGDQKASAQLLPLVYEELRRLAVIKLAQEQSGQTLQPTALVNEVYLRFIGRDAALAQDRAHVLALAARAMRQVLIDHARARRAGKRADQCITVPLWKHIAAIDF